MARTPLPHEECSSFWNYWHWYQEITGGDISTDEYVVVESVRGPGGVGLGAELIHRYGWRYEGDFLPQADPKAHKYEQAVAANNASLSTGALASPASRRGP